MRIAWFRDTAPDPTDPLDDTAPLIDELRSAHEIDVIVEQTAHDFVWQHILRPWDLCVFELDNTRAHQFVSAYSSHYAGVVFLRSAGRRDASRGAARLTQRRRLASGLCRVAATSLSRSARQICASMWRTHTVRPARIRRRRPYSGPRSREAAKAAGPRLTKFAVFDRREGGIVNRALQRAGNAGAIFDVLKGDVEPNVLTRCDVAIAQAGRLITARRRQSWRPWPPAKPS